MGNICSSEYYRSWCPWLEKKEVLNLPPKPEPVARPKPVVAFDTESSDVDLQSEKYLSIQKWDYELTKNGKSHHTSTYEHMMREEGPQLVIRRGQPFQLTLQTNVPYDSDHHKISIIFLAKDTTRTPNYGNGTQIGLLVGGANRVDGASRGWKAEVKAQKGTQLTLEISTSANAIVGKWSLEIDTEKDGKTQSFDSPTDIFILFNAWCKDDQVYIEDETERKEYVEDNFGLIWRGTHAVHRPCPWNYAHREKDILDCVLYVLNKICKVTAPHRADVLKVVRAISAGINSPDDSGVLVGNWSGSYEGGMSPTKWRGSLEILQQFYKEKEPVKFGQCWVFSGVVTTACRALGIPCRPVTNFCSAHDTHSSLTIDHFFGDDGESIEELNSDSVWNFHVWNEIWSTRPDIGTEYGGWQVIDATPQEESDGQYRCGPTSLTSIKRGEVNHPFDCPFVFAEVNADTLYWKYRGKKQPMKLLPGTKTGGVGLNISTKKVGRYAREDITNLYKHPENTREERDVMREALKRCENTFARYYLNEEINDIEFDLQLNDDIVIGKPFTVSVIISNKSSQEHTVSILLRADTMLYTGAIKEFVKKFDTSITLDAQSDQQVNMEITFDEYYYKLVDQCAFNISCLGKVIDTEYEFFAQDDFRVRKPDIDLNCLTTKGSLTVGEETKWVASFVNPLPMELTRARFYIMPTHGDSIYRRLKESIAVGGTASLEFVITPITKEDLSITIIFTSKELEDVDGFTIREVKSKKSRNAPEETIVENAI